MIYTEYIDEPVDSPYLRHFSVLYSRGNVPAAKLEYEWFVENPVVVMQPEWMKDNTTLEQTVLVDKWDEMWEQFVPTRFRNFRESEGPVHHVHLKFNRPPESSRYLAEWFPYADVLIQQNLGKLPRERLIVTVFSPGDVQRVIKRARRVPGYCGAVADILLEDKLG